MIEKEKTFSTWKNSCLSKTEINSEMQLQLERSFSPQSFPLCATR